MKASDIWNEPLTVDQKAQLAVLAAMPDSEINYKDIPALTSEQLVRMKRAYREPAKKLVAMRLDVDVVNWLKGFGGGYSTLANSILRAVKEKSDIANSMR